MIDSIIDQKNIRAQVVDLQCELAKNTKATQEVHTALFAKDDDNDLGITGLVVIMQRVVKHVEVVCNIAKWFKRAVIAGGAIAAALAAIFALFGNFPPH